MRQLIVYTNGMNLKTSKFLTKVGDLIMARNVIGKIIGALKMRNGCTKTGDTLQADKNILGLFGFEQEDGTDKHLAVVNDSGDANSTLKYNNSGTWTSIGGATSFPANAQVNFVSFIDNCYIFGADSSNSYLTTGSLDGTTYTQESGFPKARYGIDFFDKLYLADCEVGGVRYPSRIYYSSIPAYSGGWDISFTTETDYLQVQTGDGDQLMGLAKSFSRLLCFKKYSLHSWDLANLTPVEDIGTTHSDSITNLGNYVFFLHYSAKAKAWYMWNGSKAVDISLKIAPIIEGMDSSTKVCAGSKDGHVYMFIGDITLDSDIANYLGIDASYTNVLLDYSFYDNAFYIHTLPFAVKKIAPYNNELYFGDENGNVYQWDSGTTDNGTAIEAEIMTHNFYGNKSEYNQRKQWNENVIDMYKPNTATVSYFIDNGDPIPLGECTQSVNPFSLNGKGYGLKTKITSSSSDFIFEGNEIDYNVESGATK